MTSLVTLSLLQRTPAHPSSQTAGQRMCSWTTRPVAPTRGVRHIKHDAVARLLRKFMREAGAPKRRAVLEARGLAGTESLRRPGDVTWFLYTNHAHLVVDCAVAGVYQKSMLRDGL